MLLSGRKEKETIIGYIYNLNHWNFLFACFLKQFLSLGKVKNKEYIWKKNNLNQQLTTNTGQHARD